MSTSVTQPLFSCGDDVHQAKVDKVQQALRRRGLDALLLTKHDSVRYVTEFYAKGPGGDPKPRARRTAPSQTVGVAGGAGRVFEDYGLTTGRIGFDLLPQFLIGMSFREEQDHW